jgi:hypothetical protein
MIPKFMNNFGRSKDVLYSTCSSMILGLLVFEVSTRKIPPAIPSIMPMVAENRAYSEPFGSPLSM